MLIKTQKNILIPIDLSFIKKILILLFFFLVGFIVFFELSNSEADASQYFFNSEPPFAQKLNKSPLKKERSHGTQTDKSTADADFYPAIDWVAEHAIPLDTFDPEAGFEDLQPARSIFENRRLIMLGEGTHGIMEAGEYKLRFIAYLYLELGYDLIIDECGVAYGRLINEYIQTGDEKILNAVIELTGGFGRTDGYQAYLKGLRRINANRPSGYKPLRYGGFDLEFGKSGLLYLYSYLEETGADDILTEIQSYIDTCEDVIECDEAGEKSMAVFQAARDELVAASSVEKYDDVERIFQNKVDEMSYRRIISENLMESMIFREGIMKQNVDFMLAKENGGIILSAHNMHIARALTSPIGEFPYHKHEALGEYLVKTHAENEVVSLAMTFAGGTQLIRENTDTGKEYNVISFPYPAMVEGSLEDILQNVGFSPFIVEIRSARSGSNPDASWLLEPHEMLHNAYYDIIKPAPALQWDALLFIDEVRASKIVE